MAPNRKREDRLIAEIERLEEQSQKSLRDGVFRGWTREEDAVHQQRTTEIKRLIRELEALNDGKQPHPSC